MSTLLTLPRSEWRGFFDHMSKALVGKWAEIEVASLELGSQLVVEGVPLLGITYDSRDDLLDIALDRANHLIRQPREIVVEESADGLSSVAAVDDAGARHVIRLKQALTLPSAS
jgi:hypothetical protein